MADQEFKTNIIVAAEDQTKSTFQEIKSGAADMASSVQQSGDKAAKGIEGIGAGAEKAVQKLNREESAFAAALQRYTEKTRIATEAGNSMARAFEKKMELRGLDASKLNPFVQQAREAENALAALKAQQARLADQNAFLDALKSQSEVIGKTKTELLELKAAQLGMSTAAAPYIAKLREAEAGMGKVGMTAAQTANAMRMVPAQFTDIVVSLQAGQAPLTVLLQQGGQLRDLFGSAGAAARGMASYVIGLVNPYTAAAAAVAVLGLAYHQGSREIDEYRLALFRSGNQVGVTIDELAEMARSMKDAVGTQGVAAAGLAEMAQKSKVASDNLKEFTTAAIQWQKTTGQAVSETAKQFADLANDPLKATLALNEQMNFLTISVYEQIKALDEQGKKDEAAAVAQKAYADAMKTRAAELKQNLGSLERGWNAIAEAAKGAWDAMLNIGRPATTADTLVAVRKELADLEKRASADFGETGGGAATGRPSQQAVSRIKARIDALKAQETQLLATAEAEKQNAAAQETQKAAVDSANALDQLAGQFASKEVKRKQELIAAENIYLKSVQDTMKAYANTPELSAKLVEQAEKYEKAVAGINKKFTEKGASPARGENEIASIRALIDQEDEMIQRYEARGSAAVKMTEAEKLLFRLESQRAETSSATVRTEKDRAIVEAQKLVAKQAYRVELEASAKAEEQLYSSMRKSTAATEAEAEAIFASLGVYGMARTEIERMTLAKMKQHQADMELVGRPQYMAELAKQIEAQEKLVDGLQKLDYKKLDDKLTKSLDASKEELAILKDGLSLMGLDEVQRRKLIAQRKIELDLAKQIAEIDRSKFSDDAEVNAQQKEQLRQKARLKAETDTQAAILKIQEEYVNQQVQQYDEVFRRGFADMLNNGKDGWDSFTKSLTTTFKTTVADQLYKMFLRPFVVQVVAQMVGFTGAGMGLPGSGAGGAGGQLGGMTDWSSWGSNAGDWLMTQSTKFGLDGMTSMGDAAYALGNTIKSFDTWLKDIPGFSGGIGSAAGYLGAIFALTQGKVGTGIGSAIGTLALPGIGTMIGGMLGGLLDGLDDSGTPHLGAAARYRNGSSEQYRQGMPADAWVDQTYTTVSAITTALGKALDNTAKAFGQKAGYEIITAFSDDSSKDGAFGALYVRGPDGKNMVDWSSYDSKWGGRWFSDGEQGYKEYLNAIAVDVKAAFKAMDMPGWADQILDTAKDIDGLNAALQQIGTVKAVFDQLGQSMQIFSGISGDLQTQLLQTFGSVDAMVNSANAFDQGFFTEKERMDRLNGQIAKQIHDLGFEINPYSADSKEVYRKLIEDLIDTGQGELTAKLMVFADAFKNAADYAAKAAEEAEKAAKAAAEKARDAALANLQGAVDREKQYWSDIQTAAQAAVNTLSSTLSLLNTNARDLYGTVDSTKQMLAAQGMVYIESALDAVRRGQSIKGFDQLGDAISAARSGITSGRYTSQFERERDALVLAGQLSQLGELTDGQLTVEQQQLKASQEQIEKLDKTLSYWRDLLSSGKDQIDATLTVTDAIKPLYALIPDGKKPGTTTPTTPSGGAVWGGTSGGGSSSGGVVWGPAPGKPDGRTYVDLDAGTRTYGDGTVERMTPDEIHWQRLQKQWGMQSFAVGTNYVPRDMVAQIHQGERIVPAADNRRLLAALEAPRVAIPVAGTPWAGGNAGGVDLSELVTEMRALRTEVAALKAAADKTADNTSRMPRTAELVDTVAGNGYVRVKAIA